MTSAGGGVADDRANALLKAREIDSATERSAQITLADRALIAAGGDEQAAKAMLREVLEITGMPGPELAKRRTA